jgi:hypothetical protein
MLLNAKVTTAVDLRDHEICSVNTDAKGVMVILDWMEKRGWKDTKLVIGAYAEGYEILKADAVLASLDANV